MEFKKRKHREILEEVEDVKESQEDLRDAPFKKKIGRREMRDKIIMERYHKSQRKRGILKKSKKTGNDDEPSQDNDEENEEDVRNEANEMIDEFDRIKQEEKKQLKREKREFKRQQKLKAKSTDNTNNENQQKKQQNTNKKKDPKAVQKTEEGEAPESKQSKALAYLTAWSLCSEEWKFKKNFHIWLLKNWKQNNRIDDNNFDLLLKYLNVIDKKSKAIERLEKEAQTIVDTDKESSAYARARDILQWLS